MGGINVVELVIVVVLFLLVAGLGFAAARWRRAQSLMHLDEWGLGGRSFGTWITWFLLGGDLYTAYTFVAVPALMFGAGATGFFAVPYTVVIYPLVFLVVIRLWSVSHVRGFVTPADFVRSRFDSPTMALLVAITGIVATMPYIALQLVGISAVLKSMGFNGTGLAGELPLIIAFLILALYTYNSGLRAPALIAFVKDGLIYLTIIVAVIVIPSKLGGWAGIFGAAQTKFSANGGPGVILPATGHRPARLRHPRARLRAGAVPLPALEHRRPRGQQPRRAQAQHERAADLQPGARVHRAARLHGHRGGDQADRDRRQHDRAEPVPGDVPELVHRHRLLRDRHRRAGAGGDHVDRGGEPVHPQRLQGVPEEGRHPGTGGEGRQDHLARGQARRGGGDPVHQPAVLHRPAADRWRHHPADPAVGGAGPLHALDAPRRARRRLGDGDGRGAVDALRDPEARPGHEGRRQGALRRVGLRALQARLRHEGDHLPGHRLAAGQPARRHRDHDDPAGHEGARRRRRHGGDRLHRRAGGSDGP